MSLQSFGRIVLCCLVLSSRIAAATTTTTTKSPSNHAIILSSSRYWFNYRHAINALSIYQLIKSQGITDDNIVLMLADEFPSNPRNPLKNQMFADGSKNGQSLYNDYIEIDYRGDEVTVENLQKALLGKGQGRTLHTDQESNILIYWTGHGGDLFFKFQDVEEITATDLNRLFEEMHRANKYNEILFVADTCQAFTLGDGITAPNVFMIGSSLRNENSYAHHSDPELGLSVIERYTHRVMEWVKQRGMDGMSLYDGLVGHLDYRQQGAHVGYRDGTCHRRLSEVPMKDFFSNARAKEAQHVVVAKYAPLVNVSTGTAVSRHSVAPQWHSHNQPMRTYQQVDRTTTGPILHASDPMFVALFAGFIGFVFLMSGVAGTKQNYY